MIKDGIMNYVRQISQQDRSSRENNLKPTFDFEAWLSVLESSIEQTKSTPGRQSTTDEVSVGRNGNQQANINSRITMDFENNFTDVIPLQDISLGRWDTWAFEDWHSPDFTT